MRLTRGGRRRIVRAGLALGAVGLSVVVLAGSGLASSKAASYFPGTTSQGKGLQLQVSKKKVIVNYFQFTAPPCGGVGGLQFAGLEAKRKDNGKFKALSPADGYYGFVKGKVVGRRASGTAHYQFPEQGCDSGEVTWTAEKE